MTWLLQIATLKLQLEAQIVRCSHLQARLSSALDAMETLQYTHAREIAAERETKVVLNTKVNGLAEYVQRVEEERDELRDAVLALVEKGGCFLVTQGCCVIFQLLLSLMYLILP